MNTEEILLTVLLAVVIAVLLLRPFVVPQPAPRRARRRRATVGPVLRTETYRLSRQTRGRGYDPEASPVRVAVSNRKMPPAHHFGRKRNSEAYSNR